jgi:hypothetical protein
MKQTQKLNFLIPDTQEKAPDAVQKEYVKMESTNRFNPKLCFKQFYVKETRNGRQNLLNTMKVAEKEH